MLVTDKIKIVECPRDAMQGWRHFIDTEKKIRYINALLEAGFDTIDFGSFVSPKAIPQMADTKAVLKGVRLNGIRTKLLAIVANLRGAEEAMVYDEITYLGFPFSVSPVFQQRNTNSTMATSLEMVEDMHNLCIKNQKELVIYISMAFGNPYGDLYNEEIVFEWVDKLVQMEIPIISMADTVGLASPEQIRSILTNLVPAYPGTAIGVHLHSTKVNWQQKTAAALMAGCTRFDGALKGIGGCPMADDELVGNMDTELMVGYFNELNLVTGIDMNALSSCSRMADEIFR